MVKFRIIKSQGHRSNGAFRMMSVEVFHTNQSLKYIRLGLTVNGNQVYVCIKVKNKLLTIT